MNYTEEQIRAAFWALFHKSGEQWFPYVPIRDEAFCEESTEWYWQEFLDRLKSAAEPKPPSEKERGRTSAA